MSEPLVIGLKNVSKSYRLYGSQREQILDVFGLNRFRFRKRAPAKEFVALNDISLEIPCGQRVGIVGRNGAGKTTLLKLIGGNFSPSSGSVVVNGTIQALMNTGLGFHPEFTGRENIQASLQYNGLAASEYVEAVEDIARFCELGEFLDQPFKTYSLGMQSRLQFACATAIRPDILIVDEILGAGDVYFSIKSSSRMEQLTKSGATLVLVSHSMQQIIQFCERAIWIDRGKIVSDGDARSVVTAYEQFMFELSKGLRQPDDRLVDQPGGTQEEAGDRAAVAIGCSVHEANAVEARTNVDTNNAGTEEIPDWHRNELSQRMSGFAEIKEDIDNASRWVNDPRLRIVAASVITVGGARQNAFKVGEPLSVEITIEAQQDGQYDCWYVVLIYGDDGKPLVRHVSDKQVYDLKQGQRRSARVVYDELLFGVGEYHISVAIYRQWAPDDRTSAYWYELLNRSLCLKVVSLSPFDPSLFLHPFHWEISAGDTPRKALC